MKRSLLALTARVLCLTLILTGCLHSSPPDSSAGTQSSSSIPSSTPSSAPVSQPTESNIPDETKPPTEPPEGSNPKPNTADSFKAVWLSQFDMEDIYTDGKYTQRDRAQFEAMLDTVMENIISRGFNTIILQVRPYGDSMYPSAYYPMSKYVVGSYGTDATYDPVDVLVDTAHEYGMEIHAWINPLRLMTTSEITKISTKYKIRQWYDDAELNGTYLVEYNNRYYLNPAYPQVRQLILDGAAEILENYAFDGLHMDDYFYPTDDAYFDSVAYSAYTAEGGTMTLAEYRRDNLNMLVKGLYSIASSASGVYGISPAGNIDTVYNKNYADVYTWCSTAGYIDYICPQVYFGLEHGTHDFKKVSKTWNDIITLDSVSLIVGMTLGKTIDEYDPYAKTEDGKYEWRDHKDIIARCLPYTQTLEHCTGISMFCYKYMFDPETGEAISETAAEVANFLPILKEITWE